MKFDDLYNRVFIKEQDEVVDTANSEVAVPEDFDDVEPAPLPEPAPEASTEAPVEDTQTASNLSDYMNQLGEFADKLQNTDSMSLLTLVSKLNVKDTPFEGIYDNMHNDITAAARQLREISEKIKSFIIHAAKK